MSEEPSAIPLADILRAANDLVAAGLIEDYALGGALAAIYYVEPFTTYDAESSSSRSRRDSPPASLPFTLTCRRLAGASSASIYSSKAFRFNSSPGRD